MFPSKMKSLTLQNKIGIEEKSMTVAVGGEIWDWDGEYIDDELPLPNHDDILYFKQEEAGLIVWGDLSGGKAFISSLYVLPSYRGKGIGTKIINEMIQKHKEVLVNPLPISINFWKKFKHFVDKEDTWHLIK